MGTDDSLVGLTVDQQLGGVAAIGVGLVAMSFVIRSPVADSYHPLAFGVGVVMLVYAGLRFGYERLT